MSPTQLTRASENKVLRHHMVKNVFMLKQKLYFTCFRLTINEFFQLYF